MKKIFFKYKEIIMYLIMGGLTTVVSWGTYMIFAKILPISNKEVLVFVVNIISWILAVAFSYVTNKIWVFESKSWDKRYILKEISMFVSARLATGVFEIVAVPALVWLGCNQTILGVPGMLSKVIVSIVVVILNYVFSKLFVFKNK